MRGPRRPPRRERVAGGDRVATLCAGMKGAGQLAVLGRDVGDSRDGPHVVRVATATWRDPGHPGPEYDEVLATSTDVAETP